MIKGQEFDIGEPVRIKSNQLYKDTKPYAGFVGLVTKLNTASAGGDLYYVRLNNSIELQCWEHELKHVNILTKLLYRKFGWSI